jgi:hypothetical protein
VSIRNICEKKRLSMFPECFLAVEACSNGLLGTGRSYGKSPCFSRSAIVRSVDVDHGGSAFPILNMAVIQE